MDDTQDLWEDFPSFYRKSLSLMEEPSPLTESEIREQWEAGDSPAEVAEVSDQMARDGRQPSERD